jgi:RNA polymerase sigma factor (sigma-70 family)
MAFAEKLEKLVTGSVFRGELPVSEVDMSTAALQLAQQIQRENTLVAEGLKRHDPHLIDQLILEEMFESSDDDRPFEIPSQEKTPYDHFATLESGALVADALMTLEPLHREVLVLRFHEEMSLEEIARFTRAPLSTVKSRLYRGLAALKPHVSAARGRSEEDA